MNQNKWLSKPPTFNTVITINTGFIFTNNSPLIDKVEVIPGIFDNEVVHVQVLRTDNIKKRKKATGKYSYMTKQKKQHLGQNININLCGSNAKNLTTDEFWINC